MTANVLTNRFTSFHRGVAGLAVLLATLGCSGLLFSQSPDEIQFWAVPDLQKVLPDDRVEAQNLVWSSADRTIRLAGAAGEHVPFQVVVTVPPPAQPRYQKVASDFRVEVSALKATSGTIPARHLQVFLEYPVLIYGASSPVGSTGFWPDALVPLTGSFDMTAPFRSAVRNRPLWVDLDVPRDTPAGIYTGEIRLLHGGELTHQITISLRVHGFSLPEETHVLTFMGIGEGSLRNYHQGEDRREVLKRYHRILYENRMEPWFNPLLQPEINVGSDGGIELAFDEALYRQYMVDWRTKRVVFEAVPRELMEGIKEDPGSDEAARRVKLYVSRVVAYFQSHGWLDRLIFNSPIDEPNTRADYDETRRWAELVREVYPEARFLVTESPIPDDPEWGPLTGHANAFSIHGNKLNDPEVKDAIRSQQEEGAEISWYISCDQVYPQPNYFIDAPAMDPLMVPWITYRYGMNGILYWAVNFWPQTPDPWIDPVTYLSGFLCSEGWVLNGEGSLLYPGDRVHRYTGQDDVDGPVSSIRFELLREGIEDYEYLKLLEKYGAGDMAREVAEGMVIDVSAFSRNREELYRAREKMARRIEELAR